MFRKFVLAISFALGLAVLVPQISAPAHAESIYCGGSHERGIVPSRMQPGIGPYGVSPDCGGRHGGPAYYNGGHRERQVQSHSWSRTTTRQVYLGRQTVYLGTLLVPRDTSRGLKSIFVPAR
jgi:hypothetical protein